MFNSIFNSGILETAFGLAFLYSFLSLISSALAELISGLFGWRSTILRGAIQQMVGKDIAKELYDHALIASLGHCSTSRETFDMDYGPPSYIPSRLFAIALLDVLLPKLSQGNAPPPPEQIRAALITLLKSNTARERKRVAQAVLSLVDDTQIIQVQPDASDNVLPLAPNGASSSLPIISTQDTPDLVSRLQGWYDSVTDRAKGAYKRRSLLCLTFIGTLFSIGGNVDTIHISEALWYDAAVRSTLTNSIQEIIKRNPQPNYNGSKN